MEYLQLKRKRPQEEEESSSEESGSEESGSEESGSEESGYEDAGDYLDRMRAMPDSSKEVCNFALCLSSFLSDLSNFLFDLEKHDIIKEGREYTSSADGSSTPLAVVEHYNWKIARDAFDAGPIMDIFQKNNLQIGVHYDVVNGQPVPLVPSPSDDEDHNVRTDIHNPYYSHSDELDESQENPHARLVKQLSPRKTRPRTVDQLRELIDNNPVKTFEDELLPGAERSSTAYLAVTQVYRRAKTTAAAATLFSQLTSKRGFENMAHRDITMPRPKKKLRLADNLPVEHSALAFDMVQFFKFGISVLPEMLCQSLFDFFEVEERMIVDRMESYDKPSDADEFCVEVEQCILPLLEDAIEVIGILEAAFLQKPRLPWAAPDHMDKIERFFKAMYGSNVLDDLCDVQEITWNTLRAHCMEGSTEGFLIIGGVLREAISYLFVAGLLISRLCIALNKFPDGRMSRIHTSTLRAWEDYHEHLFQGRFSDNKLEFIGCHKHPKYHPKEISGRLLNWLTHGEPVLGKAVLGNEAILGNIPVSQLELAIRFGFPKRGQY